MKINHECIFIILAIISQDYKFNYSKICSTKTVMQNYSGCVNEHINFTKVKRWSRPIQLPISDIFMPPTLKKLMGHIAFGASVSAWVRGCVTLSVPTVTFKPLKLES